MSEDVSAYNAAAPVDLETAIRQKVIVKDSRFELGAYIFLYEALAWTQHRLGRDGATLSTEERHVSGQELLDGIRDYSAELFGPLAPAVFHSWGISHSRDFGRIVFNLVENELLGKTDDDRIEDFENGFELEEAGNGPIEVQPK